MTISFNSKIKYNAFNTQEQEKSITAEAKTTSPIETKNPFAVLPNAYKPLNISFKGRIEEGLKPASKELKAKMDFSEAIMNNLKNKYPSVSPTKIMWTFNQKNQKKHSDWINSQQEELNDLRDEYPNSNNGATTFVENIYKNLKNKKTNIANCGELANITQAALLANGVKNIKQVDLVGYENPEFRSVKSLDHTFLLVDAKEDFDSNLSEPMWDNPSKKYGKNAYVIDPWLGIVDTAENAMKIYKKAWENIPHYKYIQGYGCEETDYKLDFSTKEINEFKKNHPELILNKENINFKRFDK